MAVAAGVTPCVQYIYGYNAKVNNNIFYLDEVTIVYPSGHGIVILNSETKAQRFIASAESTREITALALSPNKRMLAVVESGDHALVCLHDLEKQKRAKVCKMPDSEIVVSVAFSPDGKWLLAQGGPPHWSMVLWLVEKAKPLTSVVTNTEAYKQVNQVSFCPDEPGVCCVSGNGILQFYRIIDNSLKLLANGLLKHESQNFRSHAFLRDNRLVASTDTGDLVLFENYEWHTVLSSSPADGNSIDCLLPFSKGFLAGCAEGVLRLYEHSEDRGELFKCNTVFRIQETVQAARIIHLAISPSEDNLLCTTEGSQLYTLGLSNTDIMKVEDMQFDHVLTPFHGPDSDGSSLVTGLDTCLRKPLIATCGADCFVRIWNYEDNSAEIAKCLDEVPLSVAFHPSGLHVLVGCNDKLRLMNLLLNDIQVVKEFNFAGCTVCKFSHGGNIFAAAHSSIVQIFSMYEGTMLHNLRGHKDRVLALCWTPDDAQLLTTCHDGAIIQWNPKNGHREVDFFDDRFQWTDLCPHPNGDPEFFYAMGQVANAEEPRSAICEIQWTIDGTEKMPEITEELPLVWTGSMGGAGHHPHTYFKRLVISQRHRAIFVSSADRNRCGAIRSFRWPLADNFTIGGQPRPLPPVSSVVVHGKGITQMCLTLSSERELLFSVSEDGSVAATAAGGQGSELTKKEKDAMIPFSRDVLVTKSEIQETNRVMAQLNHKVAELKQHNEFQLRLRDMRYSEKLEKVTVKFEKEQEAERGKYSKLQAQDLDSQDAHESLLDRTHKLHQDEMTEMDMSYKQKIQLEKDRFAVLAQEKVKAQAKWDKESQYLVVSHGKYVKKVGKDYEVKLRKQQESRAKLKIKKEFAVEEAKENHSLREEDAQIEIQGLKTRYDSRLRQEHDATLFLQGENVLFKRRYESLKKSIAEQKEEIKSLLQRERERHEQIKGLQKDITGHKKEIREREDTVRDKEMRIYDLKKKNQELEKFKFVLDYKIKELRRQIEPRMNEIADMRKQIKEMDQELAQYHKSNAALGLMIGELRLKINGMRRELDRQGGEKKVNDREVQQLRLDLHEAHALMQRQGSYKDLKARVTALYKLYVRERRKNSGASADAETNTVDVQKEYNRQREYLEKSVESLKRKLTKDLENHQTDHRRLIRENVLLTTEINQLRRELKRMKHSRRKKMAKDAEVQDMQRTSDWRSFVTQLSADEGEREVELQRLKILQLQGHIRKLEAVM